MKPEPAIRLMISFDHELPLGGVDKDYHESLFAPTGLVLASADRLGIKVNLFTDILSYLFFRREKDEAFLIPYEKQLHSALAGGHDVQPHFHPHWMNSTYQEGLFFPSKSFRFADFADTAYPLSIEGIIEQGVLELNTLCRKEKKDYQAIAYRAGGFNLSPGTQRILSSLYLQGIRIDSSIVKGFYYKSGVSLIDYKHMPSESNWTIPLTGPPDARSKEGMFEVPIASKPAGLATNLKHIILKRMHRERAFSTGKSIHSGKVRLLDKLRFVFSVRTLGFDVYTLNSRDLIRILDYNLRNSSGGDTVVLSSVSHPKNMGPYSIELMESFVHAVRKKYPEAVFTTFTQFYQEKFPLLT